MKLEELDILGLEVARQVAREMGLDSLTFHIANEVWSGVRIYGIMSIEDVAQTYELSLQTVKQLFCAPETSRRMMLKEALEATVRRFKNSVQG
jgi:hypothetical protein